MCKSAMYVHVSCYGLHSYAHCLTHPVLAVLCTTGQVSRNGLMICCSMFYLAQVAGKIAHAFVSDCMGKVLVQSARPASIPELL